MPSQENLHPRHLMARNYWNRIDRELRENRDVNILSSYTPGHRSEPLYDYLDGIAGTVPEKLLLQELLFMGVSVWFSKFVGDFPFTPDKEEKARPDFILPDYRIIIEVFGEYWHSREGAYERDALRSGMYTAQGFDVRIILDSEIIANPRYALFTAVPELRANVIRGGEFILPKKFNPTAAIEARLKRWPKVVRTKTQWGFRSLYQYSPTGEAPPRKKHVPGPIFRGFGPLDAEYLKQTKGYGTRYREWITGALAEWVRSVTAIVGQIIDYVWIGDPDHIGEMDWTDEDGVFHEGFGYWKPVVFRLSGEQKELVNFYFRWRKWWTRFKL